MVDARNRLAAAELERRWNEKLEEIDIVRQQLGCLAEMRSSLSPEEETSIVSMGERFAEVWHGDHCPPTLKKMVFRTVIEEIIARSDPAKKTLHFTIHWKGGVTLNWRWIGLVQRPRQQTPMEALEIIRRMAIRYLGDDQIASVLNRLWTLHWKREPMGSRTWCGHRAQEPLHSGSEACAA